MNDRKKIFGPLTPETTQVILECISDGVFTIDYNWEITSFNRAAEEITGIGRKDAIGRHCWEVFRSNMCEAECALKKTMEEGRPYVSTSAYIINSSRKKIPISVSTSLLIDKNQDIIGGVEIFRDLSVVEDLRKELSASFQVEDIVSNSNAMKKIFHILPQVSHSDATVLIEGETGTGKELLARDGFITCDHLPGFLGKKPVPTGEPLDDPVKTAQTNLICDALARNNYNRNAAAKDLGIHKSTLFRRIKKLGITL